MIGYGRHPRNFMFGHVQRQDSAGARFRDLILGNLRPAVLTAFVPQRSNREYGSTDPIQHFPQPVRVNRADSIDVTSSYQVAAKGNTLRTVGKTRLPDPRSPAKVGAGV